MPTARMSRPTERRPRTAAARSSASTGRCTGFVGARVALPAVPRWPSSCCAGGCPAGAMRSTRMSRPEPGDRSRRLRAILGGVGVGQLAVAGTTGRAGRGGRCGATAGLRGGRLGGSSVVGARGVERGGRRRLRLSRRRPPRRPRGLLPLLSRAVGHADRPLRRRCRRGPDHHRAARQPRLPRRRLPRRARTVPDAPLPRGARDARGRRGRRAPAGRWSDRRRNGRRCTPATCRACAARVRRGSSCRRRPRARSAPAAPR